MSTAASLRITRDTLTPALRKAVRGLADSRPVVEAMCLAVLSVAQRAFSQSALRAAPWPKLAGGGGGGRDEQGRFLKGGGGGGAARLRRSGELWKGLHVTNVSSRQGQVAVNKIYGAIHQFGGTIKPKAGGRLVFQMGGKTVFAKSVKIPARPFLPFSKSGEPTPVAERAVRVAVEKKVASLSGGAFK